MEQSINNVRVFIYFVIFLLFLSMLEIHSDMLEDGACKGLVSGPAESPPTLLDALNPVGFP